MQKMAYAVLYFIVIFGLKKTIIGLFRYIKIQLEREVLRTKTKESDDMQIFLTFIPTCFCCFCPHCLTIKLNI